MNYAQWVKNTALVVTAAIGGSIAAVFGGWDAGLECLVICMAVDYVTGLTVALVFHASTKTATGAASSGVAYKGLIRKAAILLAVLVAAELDNVMGTNFSRNAVILFFIGSEGLSILENFGLMGVPYPKFLQNALEALQKNNDNGGIEK